MKSGIIILTLLFMTQAFGQDSTSYLALGDSYTIGEQVEIQNSWPFQLKSYLNSEGFKVKDPEIIAVTGWRTDELQSSIASQNYLPNSYDLVSLLIGVNNQYQKRPFKQFKIEFKELLETAIDLNKNQNNGVFVAGIPDYSLSEFAQRKQLKEVSSQLRRYNRYIKKTCQRYNVKFYPLQKLSKPLHKDKEMLAEDALHPSAKQYQIWVDSFKEQVASQLNSL